MADVKGEALLTRKSDYALGKVTTQPVLELHLFVSNLVSMDCTFNPTSVTECSAPGYSPFTFIDADWIGSVVSCVYQATYPTIIFNFTGPGTPGQTIYGHYVIDSGNGDFWWGQLYSTPIVLPSGASALNVDSTWTDF